MLFSQTLLLCCIVLSNNYRLKTTTLFTEFFIGGKAGIGLLLKQQTILKQPSIKLSLFQRNGAFMYLINYLFMYITIDSNSIICMISLTYCDGEHSFSLP